MTRPGVPRYLLYGERADAVAERFVHVETIAARSVGHDWTIRPHRHGALGQMLFVAAGGGTMSVEGRERRFGRAVLTVPAGAVHAFRFDRGTEGHVVTAADPLLRALAAEDAAVARLGAAAHLLRWPEGEADLPVLLAMLAAETAGLAPLAGMAGEALLRLLLVRCCRMLPEIGAAGTAPGRAAALVARYRGQIDLRLGEAWTVADHARALGASPSRLRAACGEVAGVSPIRILHDRVAAEARRQLRYTERGVAEIGYALGFEDPAYFSRFFRRATGKAPAAWRAGRDGGGAA